MAKSGDLIQAIAAAARMPPVKVGLMYKALREAGLVSKAGRGPKSAADMTVTDAANLILGLAGCSVVREVGEVVPRLRAAVRTGARNRLEVPSTLGETIETFIRREVDDSMLPLMLALPLSFFPKDETPLARAQWLASPALYSGRPDADIVARPFYSIVIDRSDFSARMGVYRPSLVRKPHAFVGGFVQREPGEAAAGEEPGIAITAEVYSAVFYAAAQVLSPNAGAAAA